MALGRKGAGRRGEGEAPVWVCGVAECTALTAAGSCTLQDVLRCLASDNEDCGLGAVPGGGAACHPHRRTESAAGIRDGQGPGEEARGAQGSARTWASKMLRK